MGNAELVGLASTLATDVVAAACAGSICAPLVAVIDEAINLASAGKKELWPAIGGKLWSIAKSPGKFFVSPSFLWLWAVYAITYATANTVETLAKSCGAASDLPVLLCSTGANLGICLLKDSAFAKMFGRADGDEGLKAGLSRKVVSLWAARDLITQFFVFTLPALLHGRMPDLLCRLSAPVVAQYFTSPFHLLGIKLFNLPLGATIRNQWPAVRVILPQTIVARQMRIFPAFSVGGVVNKLLRSVFVSLFARH
mmetsp:Transcript_19008/g.48652  ORF Transcript_19008/g.48652 Transcript_19008/m.48652 type:complete len:254 (-) Transcript_19008:167-928(-)